ncbi:sensor histidine kinase [Colwellia sp. MT41]|uniref:sensor histidine kinase n=1 Tax=Colwellia sp. MT41 TaxID=58049 RepID=UPI0018DCD790|nr:histidine kinase [Colwellia sp. MT41]
MKNISSKKDDYFLAEYGLLGKFAEGVFASFLVNLLWLLLYLGITSNRDKKLLTQQLTEQRLTSLTNQINPHFLFNSLNTIRGMIYEDQDKAADLVTQLSCLFRYNLAIDTKGVTSLENELEVCQQYLAIEATRLGSRLQVELNMSPNTLAVQIPTMGLLTLVENAIKHGIAKLKSGGLLTIQATTDQDKVIIEVSNPYDIDLLESGTEIGLANLKQRIALIYGDAGSILINKTNSTFNVMITLPYLRHEK